SHRNIMRNNMLVNMSGLAGHAMPVDLNIEHLITFLFLNIDCMKGLLQAKGVQSTWDCLGNISATVDVLKKLKKQVAKVMKTAYQRTTHTTPKTDHLVKRVATKIYKENYIYRSGNAKVKSMPDTISVGEAKILSLSLTTFNHKICAMVDGQQYAIDKEPDLLPQCALSVNLEDSTEPELGETPVE
ncbi:hypothetical protein EI94DRAFT_1596143, partial [Lactarius quietus]